ncbi:MAG: hypothetical protein KA053_05790, partial [Lentimicrobiaceae bacterium]|nr:hypothetical protein [Lentimicrobiaceae bacterium]
MKKVIFTGLFGLIMVWSGVSQTSPISTLGTVATSAQQANVDITAIQFNGIGAGDLKILYDPAIAVATVVTVHPLLSGNLATNLTVPGVIKLGWFTYPVVSVPDGTPIFTLSFSKVSSGTSALTFLDDENGTACQFYWQNGAVVDVPTSTYYINGSLTFNAAGDAPVTTLPQIQACKGQNVSFPLKVTNFNNIGSVSLTLNYDPAVLSYISGVNNSGFPATLIMNPTPGVVTIAGFTTVPGVTLLDNSTLFTLNFKFLGGAANLVFDHSYDTWCEYADQYFNVLNDNPPSSFYIDGSVQCTTALPSGSPPQGTSDINACYVDASTVPSGVPAFDAVTAMSGYTDICGNPVKSATLGSTTVTGNQCGWQVVYTFSITDSCDNLLDGQTISHSGFDQDAPYLTGTWPSGQSGVDACFANVPAGPTEAEIAALFSDACGTVLVNKSGTPTGDDQDWTVTYTYQIADQCGNAVKPSPDITYSGGDRTAPVVSAPAGSSSVSCPADAITPVAIPDATDACAGTVHGTLVSIIDNPNPVQCNGSRVYTYAYTDNANNTSHWTYTYTVQYTGGLVPPANGSETVSCLQDAVDPGPPNPISDACGRSVTASLIGSTASPDPLNCEGSVVWRYRYTACDGSTADWTHTYTIDYSGGMAMVPANTSSTVSCAADATDPGNPGPITDACGRTVNAALVGSESTPDPVTCEGNVVWRYRYTACDGSTADWTHTYTIDYSGGMAMVPANTTSTVSCAAGATDPGNPGPITDACGRTVNAVLVGPESTPDPVTCEGSVVWKYRYTACDGSTADWTHTYDIDYSGGLANVPLSASSVVSCAADATDPGNPGPITDACGRTVNAVLIGPESTPDPVTCEGSVVWRYRYTACDGSTADWTHTYDIDYSGGMAMVPANTSSTVSCAADATDPGNPGPITDACGRTVNAILIGSESTPDPVACEGSVIWRYRYTACDGSTADWTHTYTIDYSGGMAMVPANTSSTVSCAADATDPGNPGPITDACGRTVNAVLIGPESTPDPVTCEGSVVWRYRYTACDGSTADWTHTYDIDYSGGMAMVPANTSSTVSCAADATDPGNPGPITDACGRTVNAVLVGPESTPDPVICEGSVVWRYRYTACDGSTADWTHSYTIDYSGGMAMVPANTSSTVSCATDASDPGNPGPITDACGRTVNAVLVGPESTPDPVTCEGSVVWRYRYTACDGSTADWTHTYDIDYSGGMAMVPANTSSTVSCAADATDPGNPGPINDVCGRTVNAVLVGPESTPDPVTCEG